MKIAFIGCVDFSHSALAVVLDLPDVQIVAVVTRAKSNFNADFRSLGDLAARAGCPVYFADDNDQTAMASFLLAAAPDVVYCFGWSHLLSPEILALAPLGVVGYHPAALPKNRGRHPLIWALALGLAETASTFLRMDKGADSGPILDQMPIPITEADDAASLYAKMVAAAALQIPRLTHGLAASTIVAEPQDDTKANTWRKRGQPDGEIDWRMPTAGIRNLVRALTRPYVGAHCRYQGEDVKIWSVETGGAAPLNLEPGRVLSVADGVANVKCGDGSVRIVEHEFQQLPTPGGFLQ
jgi:methionyl-tRNA formyltransferase